MSASLLDLDDDSLGHIISCLDSASQFNVSLCCRRLNLLTSQKQNWSFSVWGKRITSLIIQTAFKDTEETDTVGDLDVVLDEVINLALSLKMMTPKKIESMWNRLGPVASQLYIHLSDFSSSFIGEGIMYYWRAKLTLPSGRELTIFFGNEDNFSGADIEKETILAIVGADVSACYYMDQLHGYKDGYPFKRYPVPEFILTQIKDKVSRNQKCLSPVVDIIQEEIPNTECPITTDYLRSVIDYVDILIMGAVIINETECEYGDYWTKLSFQDKQCNEVLNWKETATQSCAKLLRIFESKQLFVLKDWEHRHEFIQGLMQVAKLVVDYNSIKTLKVALSLSRHVFRYFRSAPNKAPLLSLLRRVQFGSIPVGFGSEGIGPSPSYDNELQPIANASIKKPNKSSSDAYVSDAALDQNNDEDDPDDHDPNYTFYPVANIQLEPNNTLVISIGEHLPTSNFFIRLKVNKMKMKIGYENMFSLDDFNQLTPIIQKLINHDCQYDNQTFEVDNKFVASFIAAVVEYTNYDGYYTDFLKEVKSIIVCSSND